MSYHTRLKLRMATDMILIVNVILWAIISIDAQKGWWTVGQVVVHTWIAALVSHRIWKSTDA